MLQSKIADLENKIKLPDGIGLPGSELHSEVPLLVKFSWLELDPDEKQEAWLADLFHKIRPEAVENGDPLIVPVFGRGRALEVIPSRDFQLDLMEDLTLFMCGACSCQVKERNPGFDLLLSVDWDSELFGENGPLPPPPRPSVIPTKLPPY